MGGLVRGIAEASGSGVNSASARAEGPSALRAMLWSGLLTCACGPNPLDLSQTSRSIVGGELESGYPAVGALVTQLPGEAISTSFCTGTLIAPTWVLTAAHCVDDLSGRVPRGVEPSETFYLHFFVGSDTHDGGDGEAFAAARIIVHPGYTAPGGDRPNDIALVELAEPIRHVEPLPLRRTELDIFWRSRITYVGFGATASDSSGGGRKRRSVEVLDQILPTVYFTDQFGGGVCFGDSGGPGLHETETGTVVIGVNSTVFGNPSCEGLSTQIRVDAHLTWIDRIMGIDLDGCTNSPDLCLCDEACQADGICDHSKCGAATCDEIGACLDRCRDSTCSNACFIGASAEARFLYSELIDCAQENCAGQPSSCLEEQCRRPLYGCENGLSAVNGSRSCRDVFRCEQTCPDEDLECIDACYYQGSLDAQDDRDFIDLCEAALCSDADDKPGCRARLCRSALLTCMPDEGCSLLGGSCPSGDGCRPEAWVARYCLPHQAITVGDACANDRACVDGALCVGGTCREVCSDATDCERSFAPCQPVRLDTLQYSIGVCSLDCPDADMDGACDDADCAPYDGSRYPNAEELCDPFGIDEDCDGERNEGCDGPDGGVTDAGTPDLSSSDAGAPRPPKEGGCRCADSNPRPPLGLLFGLLLVAGWRLRRPALLLAMGAALGACGDDVDYEPFDAGLFPDAQVMDTSTVLDAGGLDAGRFDTGGGLDAGIGDASGPPPPGIFEVQQKLVPDGTIVELDGVVAMVLDEGFFLSEPEPRPFGGVFVVWDDSPPDVAAGARVRVLGTVEEAPFSVGNSTVAVSSRTQVRIQPSGLVQTGTAPPLVPYPLVLPELVIDELAEPYEGVFVTLNDVTLSAWTSSTSEGVLDGLLSVRLPPTESAAGYRGPGQQFEHVSGVVQFDAAGFSVLTTTVSRAPVEANGCLPLAEHLLCGSRRSWIDAHIGCRQRGGRLVVLETPEENATVSARVREFTEVQFWLGLSDSLTEGTWLWTDGSTLAYDAWASGEPNDAGGSEDCGQGNFRNEGEWNDGYCGSRLPFVCEFDRPAPTCVSGSCGEGAVCTADGCRPS